MHFLEFDDYLDRFACVHRTVAIRDLIEFTCPIENTTRFDPAFENIREQFLDVRTSRGRTSSDGYVAKERWLSRWHHFILRNPNASHRSSWAYDAKRRPCLLFIAYTI